jgi:hypothetical protein
MKVKPNINLVGVHSQLNCSSHDYCCGKVVIKLVYHKNAYNFQLLIFTEIRVEFWLNTSLYYSKACG